MSEKIKLAIIGCGWMAGNHMTVLQTIPDAEVVALCDIKRENLERAWRERFAANPAIRLYDSYQQLLNDPPAGLRGVLVATYHTSHFEISTACLEHGLDVLVEKPMCTSSDDARKLAATIKKTGRHFQIAFQSTYSSEFAYIRDVIQKGGIGTIQTVTALSCQGWKSIGNIPQAAWRLDPKLSGGGQMYDTGAHLFASIAWLIDRPVTEVFCWLDNCGMPVDINSVMTIRWEGNILGSVTISGDTPGWQDGIWISGDKGRLVTGIHAKRLEHYDAAGEAVKYPLVTQTNYTPMANFVACLQGKAQPRCPERYGLLHSWLMDALYQSAREGRPVKVSKPPL